MIKRALLAIAVVVSATGVWSGVASAQGSAPVVCNTTPQGTAIAPALLTSVLPCAVEAVAPFDLVHLQNAFDFFSWLSFLALNAPADGSGPIGKDAPAVWESWKNIFAVMVPPGQTPAPWGAPDPIPPICQTVPHDTGAPVLRMVGKTPDLLTAFDQPFNTGPLIDQDGSYVHYEILINQPMFDYIIANKLYSKAGQAAFSGKISFPGGEDSPAAVGAIMVKAAWKVLQPGDDAGNFHTETALLYQPAVANPPIAESCRSARMVLVGLHVGHKTVAEPQWIWSTFEQVANAPSQADVTARTLLARYNFYHPGSNSPVNTPPARPWNPNIEPFAGNFHSQIVRVTALDAATVALNRQFQSILPGIVWAHYELLNTQWPTDPTSKTDLTGKPAPQFLANTTMETYIQGNVPLSSSSCMDCHKDAADKQGHFSDFTYILERAQ